MNTLPVVFNLNDEITSFQLDEEVVSFNLSAVMDPADDEDENLGLDYSLDFSL